MYDSHSIATDFLKDSSWSFLSSVIVKGLSLITTVAVARLLGPRDFGIYGVLISLVYMVSILGNLGINNAVAKFIPEYDIIDSARIKSIIGTTMFIALGESLLSLIVLFASADYLSQHVYHTPVFKTYLLYTTVLIVTALILNLGNGYLQGLRLYKDMAVRNFYLSLLALPVTIGLVKFFGVLGAIMSTVIVNAYNLFLIGRIITRFFSQKGMGGGYGFDRALAGKIMSYSLPVFLSGLCNVPILWIANTLLASRWGFGEVGVFNAAYNLAIQVAFITTAINYPLVPLYSKLLAEGDHSGLEKLFLKNIKMTCLITLAMALVMGLNARWIIWTLYGPAYGASEMILVWMVVSVVLSSINSVIGMLILASGKVWIALMVNAIWTMVVSVFLFLLIPRMGAISIAISFVMAYLIHTLVLNLVTSKVFTIRIRDWKILVSSLSLLLVPFLNRFHNPFISNVSLGIILVILWVLNVNAFEKKVMLSFLKKQIYVL